MVPGADGRAGMAALGVAPGFDIAGLAGHLRKRLPAYARPLFLRITREMRLTETFKLKKHEFQREGFDPSAIADALYFDDGTGYAPLDAALYARISSGRVRI
jgi:fatty-acyl-CoA synthase